MATQGRAFTEHEIQRIKTFLAETDMTIAQIATRMHCSRSAVASINRKWKVRVSNGITATQQKSTDVVNDLPET